MEKLNPCGSKAGEYVGKPVLSAPTPGVSWAAFPSSFRICLTSLSGGWRGEVLPSCGHAGGGGGGQDFGAECWLLGAFGGASRYGITPCPQETLTRGKARR